MKKKGNLRAKKSPDMVLRRTFRGAKATPVSSATQSLAHKLKLLSIPITDIRKDNSLRKLGLEDQGHGVWRFNVSTKPTRYNRCIRVKGNQQDISSANSGDEHPIWRRSVGHPKKVMDGLGENYVVQTEGEKTSKRGNVEIIDISSTVESSDSEPPARDRKLRLSSIKNKSVICRTKNKTSHNQVVTEKQSLSQLKSRSSRNRSQIVAPNEKDLKGKKASVLHSASGRNSNVALPLGSNEVKKSLRILNRCVALSLMRDVPRLKSQAQKNDLEVLRGKDKALRAHHKDDKTCTKLAIKNSGLRNVTLLEGRASRKRGGETITSESVKKQRLQDMKTEGRSRMKTKVTSPSNASNREKNVGYSKKNASLKKPKRNSGSKKGGEKDLDFKVSSSTTADGKALPKLKLTRKHQSKFQMQWCDICGVELHSLDNKLEHEFSHQEPRQLFVSLHRCYLNYSTVKLPIYVSSEDLASIPDPKEDTSSPIASDDDRHPLLPLENVLNDDEENAYESWSSSGDENGNVESEQPLVEDSTQDPPLGDPNGVSLSDTTSPATTPERNTPNKSPKLVGSRERSKRKSQVKMRLWQGSPITRSGRVVKITQKTKECLEQSACIRALFTENKKMEGHNSPVVEEDNLMEEKLVEEESAGEEKLVEEESADEEKLVEEESAGEEKLVEEESAGEEKLVKEESAGEEKLVGEESAGEEKLVGEESAGEEKLVEEESAGEEKLVEEESAGEEKLVEEESAGEEKLVEEEIAGEEKLVEEEIAGEEKLVEEEIAGEEKLVEEESAGEEKLIPPVDEYVEVVVMKGDLKDIVDSGTKDVETTVGKLPKKYVSAAADLPPAEEITVHELHLKAPETEAAPVSSDCGTTENKDMPVETEEVNDAQNEKDEEILSGDIMGDGLSPVEEIKAPESHLEVNEALETQVHLSAGSSTIKNEGMPMETKGVIDEQKEKDRDSVVLGDIVSGVEEVESSVNKDDVAENGCSTTSDMNQNKMHEEESDETLEKRTDSLASEAIEGIQEDVISLNLAESAPSSHDSNVQEVIIDTFQECKSSEPDNLETVPEKDSADLILGERSGIGRLPEDAVDDKSKDMILVDESNDVMVGETVSGNAEMQESSDEYVSVPSEIDISKFNIPEDQGLEDISDDEWMDMSDKEMQPSSQNANGHVRDVQRDEESPASGINRVGKEGEMDGEETEKDAGLPDAICTGEAISGTLEEEMKDLENSEDKIMAENPVDEMARVLSPKDAEGEESVAEMDMTEAVEDPEDRCVVGVIDEEAEALEEGAVGGGEADKVSAGGQASVEGGVADLELVMEGKVVVEAHVKSERSAVGKKENCVLNSDTVGEAGVEVPVQVSKESQMSANGIELVAVLENGKEQGNNGHCEQRVEVVESSANKFAVGCKGENANVLKECGFKVNSDLCPANQTTAAVILGHGNKVSGSN